MVKEDDINGADYRGLIEESAEDLYENAPCGYLSTMPDGTFLKVNKTFLTWVEYEREELLFQKKFQDLLPIGGKIFYETHIGPLLRMQGFVNEVNFDLKGKKGQLLPVLVNTNQIKGEDGQPLLNRITVFNITDRKKYEQELLRAKKEAEEATRVKAEFLSTVSHEIRTPLNAIISIANLLQEANHTSEQDEYFRTLKISADNLLHLINDILDYSKIEAGRVELAERDLNLKELIYSLLYSVSITAEEKGLVLNVELDEQLPEFVLGDPVKIGQVLTNLLSNAIKFTEKGSVQLKVQVQELTEKDVFLSFSVTDTGIGIPKDKLEKIFNEFTQADYEINLKYGGTGLGLSISQKLLALYGSRLSVESEEGKGATFSFDLCLKLGQEPTATAGLKAGVQEPSIRGVKLLLVEDNAINVMVISKYLEKWGIMLEVARNGAEAVEKVQQQDYELVLMDLQMPDMDGYEASTVIRNLPEEKYRKLPIIALSASARFDYRERMDAAGINDFVNKPFNASELFSKIGYYTRTAAQQTNKAAAIEPQISSQSEQTEVTSADAPAFTLETFEELLEHNDKDLEELVRMTIRNLDTYNKDFNAALLENNLREYRVCHHKIKMTVELLKAEKLRASIMRGRALLEEENKDTEKRKEACSELNIAFDAVIVGLKEVLHNRWHGTHSS